jgi:hemoglobin-like flavoprotein
MTPEQIALVQQSVEGLAARSDEMTRLFYANLFELDPPMRALFPTDMFEQRVKFFTELLEIARAINDLDRFVARGAELGRQHHGYGVRSVDFRFGGEALIAALAELLGDDLTAELETAWRTAYHLVSEVMLGGATRSVAR